MSAVGFFACSFVAFEGPSRHMSQSSEYSRSQALSASSTQLLRNTVLQGESNSATARFFAIRKERSQAMMDERRKAVVAAHAVGRQNMAVAREAVECSEEKSRVLLGQEWQDITAALQRKFDRDLGALAQKEGQDRLKAEQQLQSSQSQSFRDPRMRKTSMLSRQTPNAAAAANNVAFGAVFNSSASSGSPTHQGHSATGVGVRRRQTVAGSAALSNSALETSTPGASPLVSPSVTPTGAGRASTLEEFRFGTEPPKGSNATATPRTPAPLGGSSQGQLSDPSRHSDGPPRATVIDPRHANSQKQHARRKQQQEEAEADAAASVPRPCMSACTVM
jgi:hypothetical protein